jgi:hypothetical protein
MGREGSGDPVSHGEVGGLALGDGVEDDGGEVGHEVRRLAAQGRQVPHRSSLRVHAHALHGC